MFCVTNPFFVHVSFSWYRPSNIASQYVYMAHAKRAITYCSMCFVNSVEVCNCMGSLTPCCRVSLRRDLPLQSHPCQLSLGCSPRSPGKCCSTGWGRGGVATRTGRVTRVSDRVTRGCSHVDKEGKQGTGNSGYMKM